MQGLEGRVREGKRTSGTRHCGPPVTAGFHIGQLKIPTRREPADEETVVVTLFPDVVDL